MFEFFLRTMSVQALERLVYELQIAHENAMNEIEYTRESRREHQRSAANALLQMSVEIEKFIYEKEHS